MNLEKYHVPQYTKVRSVLNASLQLHSITTGQRERIAIRSLFLYTVYIPSDDTVIDNNGGET